CRHRREGWRVSEQARVVSPLKVLPRAPRGPAAPRRPIEEADLKEIRLVDLLESTPVLADGRRERGQTNGSAVELLENGGEQPSIDLVETESVHLETLEGPGGSVGRDHGLALDLDEIAHAAEQAIRDARCAPRAPRDLDCAAGVETEVE